MRKGISSVNGSSENITIGTNKTSFSHDLSETKCRQMGA